jgi:hypothetical protein
MSEEIDDYVEEHAPELDPREVRDFMAHNTKPVSEPGTQLEWATRLLRRRRAEDRQEEEGPALELVEEEMRRHDERQQQ